MIAMLHGSRSIVEQICRKGGLFLTKSTRLQISKSRFVWTVVLEREFGYNMHTKAKKKMDCYLTAS